MFGGKQEGRGRLDSVGMREDAKRGKAVSGEGRTVPAAPCWAEGWEGVGRLRRSSNWSGFLGRRRAAAGPPRSGSSLGLVGSREKTWGRHAGRKEEVEKRGPRSGLKLEGRAMTEAAGRSVESELHLKGARDREAEETPHTLLILHAASSPSAAHLVDIASFVWAPGSNQTATVTGSRPGGTHVC